MNTVTSKDGTQIAYDKRGQGPALILVDGALCYRSFGPMPGLAELLSSHFTVYNYDRRGRGEIRLARLDISTGANDQALTLATGRPAMFVFHLTGMRPRTSCIFTIYDDFGQPLATFNSAVRGPDDAHDASLGNSLVCNIEELPLVPGRYRINVAISADGELQVHLEGAAFFEVEQGAIRGRPVIRGKGYGRICLQHHWTNPA